MIEISHISLFSLGYILCCCFHCMAHYVTKLNAVKLGTLHPLIDVLALLDKLPKILLNSILFIYATI